MMTKQLGKRKNEDISPKTRTSDEQTHELDTKAEHSMKIDGEIHEPHKQKANQTKKAEWQDELGSWQDPKLVDSMIDSAPLFAEEWDPDDIVREIEADENFRVRILTWDTLPDEYED